MSDADRQDPIFFRTKGHQKGRDGARVPLPWNNHEANFGFTTGKPWLPMQEIWRQYSVESEEQDPQSSLNLYRKALQLRKELLLSNSEITWTHTDSASGVLSYRRGKFEVVLNTTNHPIDLNREVILSSQPMASTLPAKCAAWLQA